jgi:hypothetical protein
VDATEAGLVRQVVDDPRVGARALEGMNLTVVQTPVRLMDLPHKRGALAEMAERLGERKVNLNFAYGTAGKSMLVIEARSESH